MSLCHTINQSLSTDDTSSWLNEGWTMYLERRINASIHGPAHFDFSAVIGWKHLGELGVNEAHE